MLGTVATTALRQVTCPLLVVRRPERLWNNALGEPLRVLVPFALDVTDTGLKDALGLVASTGDFSADFIHYRHVPETRDQRGQTALVTKEALVAYLGQLPVGLDARSITERDAFGRLDWHLRDLAHEKMTDLIVCGSHHRHGVERMRDGSIAEGIVLHSPVSVLVARAP